MKIYKMKWQFPDEENVKEILFGDRAKAEIAYNNLLRCIVGGSWMSLKSLKMDDVTGEFTEDEGIHYNEIYD